MKKWVIILILGFSLTASSLFAQSIDNLQSIIQIILLAVLVLIVSILLFRQMKKSGTEENTQLLNLQAELKQLSDERTTLAAQKTEIEKQRDKISLQLEEKLRTINELEKRVAFFENNEDMRKKEADKRLSDLENSRLAFEKEQIRINREDEERQKKERENYNRIWNDHEVNAITKMREVCKRQSIPLATYDNTNLPEDFDPALKPDFMVELLKQYVIFDPKHSKADNLNIYIQNQVKSTAAKIKRSKSRDDIYPTVFFIVPNIGMSEIKETYHVEQGISFFVIALESFEPILKTLQRLEEYDLTDKFDPKDREKVVNLIALLNQYVRQQNATNILSVLQGFQALGEISSIPKDLFDDVENKRKKQGEMPLTQQKIKKLMENPREQVNEVLKMIETQEPKIKSEEVKNAAQDGQDLFNYSPD